MQNIKVTLKNIKYLISNILKYREVKPKIKSTQMTLILGNVWGV